MITRKQFAEEERRIRQHRKAGKPEHWIAGWLRKWREVGERYEKVLVKKQN
jgi:hypothetical protein